MIILTSGPRDFAYEAVVHDKMKSAVELMWYVSGIGIAPKIINGGARGCDSFVKNWCKEEEYSYQEFKPEYRFPNDSAAPLIRNEQMAKMCDLGIIFWSGCNGPYRGGTLHTMNCLARFGKKYIVMPLQRDENSGCQPERNNDG